MLGDGAGAMPYRVRLLVKETNEGYRSYDHDLRPRLRYPGPPSPGAVRFPEALRAQPRADRVGGRHCPGTRARVTLRA